LRVFFLNYQVLIIGGKSKRTTAANSVSAEAKRVILLSGTPALSRPEELYSQLQILERKPFG
jgi:SWI/SNF-related matrix-associated actin-dependent regulator 1 of chromatin subfamily A